MVKLYRSNPIPATTAPISDDPTRTVPAALKAVVGEADEDEAEPEAVDLDKPALALLEVVDDAAVTIPVDEATGDGATMIPPAAVAAVAVAEAFPEAEASIFSTVWMIVKASSPPQLASGHPTQGRSH